MYLLKFYSVNILAHFYSFVNNCMIFFYKKEQNICMSKIIKYLTKVYKEDGLSILGSSISFFVTISAIPFIALLLFLLGMLSPELVSAFEELIKNLVPEALLDGFFVIIEKIKETDIKIFLPISIITAIWASSKGVGGLCRGIESVYDKSDRCGWLACAIKTVFRAVIFFIVTVLSLVVFSLGKLLYESISTQSTAIRVLLTVLVKLRFVALFFVLALFFTLLYRCLYKEKGLLKHLPGALFSATGWLAFTFFYSKFLDYVLSRPSIYLGMGTLVFFMLWVYFCTIIMLLGAELNKYYIYKKHGMENM